MKNIAFISLGANIDDRLHFIQMALQMLRDNPRVSIEDVSSIYETEPIGYTEQPKFLNMVVKITTSFTPFELLDITQSIENTLGRKREIRWGPRTIDLDILLYNHQNISSEQLIIPHPRMFERAFVMVPLLEIAKEISNVYDIDSQLLKKDQGVFLMCNRNKVLQM